MKKLLVLIALIGAVSCTKKQEAKKAIVIADPKFAYLQEVSITGGFLRGQSGKVKRYYACGFNDTRQYNFEEEVSKNGYCYDVELKNEETWNNISEKDLI